MCVYFHVENLLTICQLKFIHKAISAYTYSVNGHARTKFKNSIPFNSILPFDFPFLVKSRFEYTNFHWIKFSFHFTLCFFAWTFTHIQKHLPYTAYYWAWAEKNREKMDVDTHIHISTHIGSSSNNMTTEPSELMSLGKCSHTQT